MTPTPWLVAAVGLGGAAGAVGRWSLGGWLPDGTGFPWTTFAINVVGCLTLALLPRLGYVRHRQVLAVGLGPGLLGGFTTLSATSVQGSQLIETGQTPLAAAYLLGTLLAALAAVSLAESLSGPAELCEFADEEGDR